MKKITLKISAFLLLSMFALQVQAQRFPADVGERPGIYKIKLQGQDLYLTLNTTTDELNYEAELPSDDEKQVFTIEGHPRGSHYSITSTVAGKGVVEAFEPGQLTSKLGCKGNSVSTADTPTPVQQDQWNPTRGSGTQIFLENDDTDTQWSGAAKRRIADVVTPASGVVPELNGGSTLSFDFIKLSSLSNEEFDTKFVYITNPVKDKLNIESVKQDIKQISIYNLLGQRVMSNNVEGNASSIKLDVSSLISGIYIVKMGGENNAIYSKKIIKE